MVDGVDSRRVARIGASYIEPGKGVKMSSDPRIPNKLLRRERELRGLTLQDVADRLYKLCEKEGRDSNISANIVGRWERGVSIPQPHYQRKLCRLFGKSTTAELGFLEQQDVTEPPSISQIPSSIPGPSTIPGNDLIRENAEASLQFDKQILSSAYSRQVAPVQSLILDAGSQAGVSSDILPGMPAVYLPQHQAVDVLHPKLGTTLEQQGEAGVALISGDLAPLFDLGWSIDEIFDAQRIILEGLQAMPESVRKMISRRALLDRFFKLTVAAMMSSIPIFTSEKHVSLEERTQLHSALGENIGAAWKRFTTASMSQVLVIGQAQLQVIRYVHEELYPTVRPLFYSPVYRLIGAALFFQSRYAEALHFHKQAYFTAIEACDPWNMAESLSWQAGVLKACGRQIESIQTTEAALHLLSSYDDSRALTSRARFLAHWAESAALLGERDMMDEKLAASAELLNQCEGNDEFDFAIWQLYRGTCSLYTGDFPTADTYLQQALDNLSPNLLHQRASTRLLQAQARLKVGDGKGSLEATRTAVPLVAAADSPLLFRGFVDHVQKLTTAFPGDAQVKDFAGEVQQHPQLHILYTHAHGPRYLEATL
ncbi:MAG TPA: helix-turn-helix transcriptional regulator [Ktedonobacteraceae bacterium]|nr:helix-turn-helix transcriptional regulator [Ktedonobacteraceae bacterium]